MIRGTTRFQCTECGERFIAPDIEYMATVFSVPQKCPKCQSYHTMPTGALFQKTVYKKIWEQIDREKTS